MSIVRVSKREWKISLPINNPVTPDDIKEMQLWCNNILGRGGRNKMCKWRYGWINRQKATFYFKREPDATLFLLRWL